MSRSLSDQAPADPSRPADHIDQDEPDVSVRPGEAVSPELTTAAEAVLAELAGPAATLRPDQLAAIDALVTGHERVLLVQATGWGKSAVYWIATRLLRAAGGGPTLVVSPLLALMRNQVAAAQKAGIRAEIGS